MVAAAQAAGRVLDVAFNHRQRGDIQALEAGDRRGTARAHLLREGVVDAADRHPAAGLAGSPTPSRRAAGRCWTSASTCSTTRCSCSGSRRWTTVSASTYDLLGTAGFGSSPHMSKTGSGVARFDVEDLASAFLRLSDGGTLLVEASWAAHRQSFDEFGITLFGTEGGADLRVVDMEPIGTLKVFTDEAGVAAESLLSPPAGQRARRGRRAVPRAGAQRRRVRRRGRGGARARRRRVLPLRARAARGHVRLIVWTPRSGVHTSISSWVFSSLTRHHDASVSVEPERGGCGSPLCSDVVSDARGRSRRSSPRRASRCRDRTWRCAGRSAGPAAGPWPSAPATSSRSTARRPGTRLGAGDARRAVLAQRRDRLVLVGVEELPARARRARARRFRIRTRKPCACRVRASARRVQQDVERDQHGDRLRELIDLVLSSLDEPANGAALAARAHFSRDHLDRLLAAATGESPVALRRRLLLERAAWQLRGGAAVSEVFEAAGYGSLAAFSRAFSRAFGVPPQRLRRRRAARRAQRHPLPPAGGDRRAGDGARTT